MADYFDVRTLSFVSGVVAITLWGCMFFVANTQKVYPGFENWTGASLINGIGLVLLSLRGVFPDLLTIVIANLLVIVFYVLVARGLVEFVGGTQRIWLDILPIVFFTAAFLFFTYYLPNVTARVVTISLLIAFLSGRSAFIVFKQIPLLLPGANQFLLISFVCLTAWFITRIFLTLVFENQILDFMSAGVIQGLTIVIVFVTNITIMTGLIIMNAQRLESDLAKAKDKVKSLSGLLPICSSCKKIRDDSGYWQDVAVYVRDHSEADFSHGICPECMERLYPEFVKRVK